MNWEIIGVPWCLFSAVSSTDVDVELKVEAVSPNVKINYLAFANLFNNYSLQHAAQQY